ncbi:MAG: phytanoyl-CoA dioxygenase family protein [Lentisphaerae bacterium]|nr:phytanoyl-CoA dioxygenase family protein [Lentisphaerota bacterium]
MLITDRPLTVAERHQWDRDGYLLLRGLIPLPRLNAVQKVFEGVVEDILQKLQKDGQITDTHPGAPFDRRLADAAGKRAGTFGRSWRKKLASHAVFDLHATPSLTHVMHQLIGTDVIGHPVFNGRPKLPGQQLTVVPWHQDSGYFGAASDKSLILTTWIPLVPVDARNGCLQVIPGTHKLELRQHEHEKREGDFLEADMTGIDESRAVTCAMLPGDVLIFNNLTMHRSLESVAPTIRWSIDLRFIRDGDPLGAIGWHDPAFKWVIRSDQQPVTTYDAWMADIAHWPW